MKVVIEVGANDGDDTDLFVKKYVDIPILVFEPIPKFYYELSERYRDNPHVHVLPQAVDIVNGYHTFNISEISGWGCSSLHQFAPDIHNKWSQSSHTFTRQILVSTIRLDAIVEIFGITEIEYLHIDAQGNDFRVLQSLGSYISMVKAGVCEAGKKTELYDVEGNNVKTVRSWLRKQGYKTRVEDDGVGKLYASVTGHEANIFFTRKNK